MEIFGTVRGEPTMIEKCCIFLLEGKEGLYLILSTDRQAVKDHIFIEKGQWVQMTGSVLEQEQFQGIFITEKAKIEIRKNFHKNFEKSETFPKKESSLIQQEGKSLNENFTGKEKTL